MRTIDQNSTFSEHGHVVYQVAIILHHYLSIDPKDIIKFLKCQQNNCIWKCLFNISLWDKPFGPRSDCSYRSGVSRIGFSIIVRYRCKRYYYNILWAKPAWPSLRREFRPLSLFAKASFIWFRHILTRWRTCVCTVYSKKASLRLTQINSQMHELHEKMPHANKTRNQWGVAAL